MYITQRGFVIYKGVGVRFADFISFFLSILWKRNNLVSLRPNYFIFIGHLKIGGVGGGGGRGFERITETPLDRPLPIDHLNQKDLF